MKGKVKLQLVETLKVDVLEYPKQWVWVECGHYTWAECGQYVLTLGIRCGHRASLKGSGHAVFE